jgi:hypothetical protein
MPGLLPASAMSRSARRVTDPNWVPPYPEGPARKQPATEEERLGAAPGGPQKRQAGIQGSGGPAEAAPGSWSPQVQACPGAPKKARPASTVVEGPEADKQRLIARLRAEAPLENDWDQNLVNLEACGLSYDSCIPTFNAFSKPEHWKLYEPGGFVENGDSFHKWTILVRTFCKDQFSQGDFEGFFALRGFETAEGRLVDDIFLGWCAAYLKDKKRGRWMHWSLGDRNRALAGFLEGQPGSLADHPWLR